MSDLTIPKRVNTIIEAQMGIEFEPALMLATSLDDTGADSLDKIEIVMSIEAEFDLEIPDEDFEKWKTIGDIIAYLEQRLARRQVPA